LSFERKEVINFLNLKVSLPRSYTLPREFKYYRRNKGRKTIKNEHFIASTNSSDGKNVMHVNYLDIFLDRITIDHRTVYRAQLIGLN
jgi:hypothetical protein